MGTAQTRTAQTRTAQTRTAQTGTVRTGTVWCPNWPVVVARAEPDEPVIVLRANQVVAVSRAAEEHGVSPGMRRRQAQGRCPGARLVAHDPDSDGRAFERVARAVAEMVPRVEIGEPGQITFAARGPARYFGGETAFAARLLAVVTEAAGASLGAVGGFGVGVADGRFAAGIAARRSARTVARPVVVPSGTEATARYLADLPIRLLGLVGGVDDDLVLLFQRLGLYHLGDLAALEDADVLARFAAPGRFARRLAAGVDERLPDAHDPPVGLAVEHHFDEPVHHADIVVFTARRLADGLVGHLGADGRVCIRAHVTIETEHGERSERLWYRSTGLVAAAIVERTRWQLDGWANSEALTAGITLLRLDPVEIRADDGVQQGMWGGRTQADDWALRAVARLAGIVGEEHVVVPAARGGRLVHDQYTWVSASTVELAEGEARVRPPVEPWPGRNTGPSPAVVHDPPVVIQVHDAAGTPVQVSGRGQLSAPPAAVLVGGHWLAVRYWAGPWPVEQRWWDAATHRRVARFQLLTDDQRLFDVGLEDRRWWMHAEHA